MADDIRPGRARIVGRVLLRLFTPFPAILTTVRLSRRELQRRRQELAQLGQLARDVAGRPADPQHGEQHENDCSRDRAPAVDEPFEQAMARSGRDAAAIARLRCALLRKKRMALALAAVFGLMSALQVFWGLTHETHGATLLGVMGLAASQPLCFVLAMSAHFRIWQLDNRRLSSAELGGLTDFKREVPRWWLAVLDPEMQRRPKE